MYQVNVKSFKNKTPLELLLSFLDEETGGVLGMRSFIDTIEFKALNVGFALDEGIASPNEVFSVYYAERSIWSKCLSSSWDFFFIVNIFFFRGCTKMYRSSWSWFTFIKKYS